MALDIPITIVHSAKAATTDFTYCSLILLRNNIPIRLPAITVAAFTNTAGILPLPVFFYFYFTH